ncbi:hypothetical protein ACIQAL_03725 [Pseudomonas sp. NPDC088368]|uniref:hypothetical protein n=1 Tax=Pseudomonas sp. NPDC088368 TaxID=3364453 RepID=UPI00380283F6
MNVDLTAIQRNVRLFALPISLITVGLIGMLICAGHDDQTTPLAAMMTTVLQVAFWAALTLAAIGASWLARNTWLLWRWESGELVGSCTTCGGVMQHRNGRWSQYSRCNMCGSTRQGWH